MLKLVAAIVATRRHGRRESGRPDLIYLAHSAKESSTPAAGFGNGRSIRRADRPNDGRHAFHAIATAQDACGRLDPQDSICPARSPP